MRSGRTGEVLPLDPEIEATCRKNNARRSRKKRAGKRGGKSSNMADEKIPPNQELVNTGEEQAEQPMRYYLMQRSTTTTPVITRPAITGNFKIKPGFIQMIQNGCQFASLPNQDPHEHLRAFVELCDTLHIAGVHNDTIKLRMFGFSLIGKAKHWLQTLAPGSIGTWEECERLFLERYFPPSKTMELRNEITNFKMTDGETLYEAWDRFKEAIRRCPNHGLEKWSIVTTFFKGALPSVRNDLNSAAGGSFIALAATQAYELLETMARDAYAWGAVDRTQPKRGGLHAIDEISALHAKIEALTASLAQVTTKPPTAICEVCIGPHSIEHCPLFATSSSNVEQVNYMGNRPPNQAGAYSNTYNPGWRNHPNFSWSNNNQNVNRPPPGFEQERKPSNDDTMAAMSRRMDDFIKSQDQMNKNLQASIHNVERQMGQLSNQLSNRPAGALPSHTEVNPRDAKLCAITLRSGKELVDPPTKEKVDTDKPLVESQPTPPQPQPAVKPYRLPVPFLQRLQKKKEDEGFHKFLDLFKQLHINIPFAEALEQMPTYAKFLKDLLTKKRNWNNTNKVMLTHECSALIQNQLPEKLQDPGCFTIPCVTGSKEFSRSLCDLGAGINLMPYSVYKRLGLPEELKPTRMTLQLADRSIKYPKGVIENILVKVGKFIFPADFVILEMEEDREVPLILGRPFLATGNALIDVQQGKLTLRVGKDEVTFDVSQSKKYSSLSDDLYFIDVIDNETEAVVNTPFLDNLCDEIGEQEKCGLKEDFGETMEFLPQHVFEVSMEKPTQALPSVVHPPKLEQKPLPEHLKYAYLGNDSTLPVIISSSLTLEQEEKLLQVLRQHIKAIGWTIADITGISPAFCMHKILMEEGHKPTIEHHRRLNPHMKEVVQKEVMKLLDAGIIYPISDSPWVSPVQVVPKKGGITVVPNEKNELIPTRTVTGWRVCIDYRKLIKATRKYHFPLPFIDQMLERLAGYAFYCFLDGYSGYFQIPIAPEDQEKTTFTCPSGTYAYRRMPFGLCNAPATFQRCMMAIFSEMVETSLEVFMDDFSTFGTSFEHCFSNLASVLQRCEETNLVLNWEKCHSMVTEGIVLGHRISARGIEVDRAKIEVIDKLPPPTTLKGIRSLLGHAGFYRRFIKDFSKISKPLCDLLAKDSHFIFTDECLKAFTRLKKELTSAPIMLPPDWTLPFELMCDASDFAVGAVLGQKKDGKLHAIYYASKLLNDAQLNYTTTEKELLAVVYAFDKFRSYLMGSNTIVYTDHSAIKYLLSKKDAKPRLLRWVLLLQEFDLEIRDK
ncbi:Retrovirus-related Pol polyprotein from transposon 17.6 [Linum grandiflorum]